MVGDVVMREWGIKLVSGLGGARVLCWMKGCWREER